MQRRLWCRLLLVFSVLAAFTGCQAKPAGTPIVLRPPPAGKPLVRRPEHPRPVAAAAPPTAVPKPAADRPAQALTPEEKEALFRDFDEYLTRSGRP